MGQKEFEEFKKKLDKRHKIMDILFTAALIIFIVGLICCFILLYNVFFNPETVKDWFDKITK